MEISVIIPVYNQVHALKLTLESLLTQQDYDLNYECIIVDDGSTEDIAEVVSSMDISSTPRCKLITQVNSGRSVARNRAIEHSKGEIIIFCDADRVPSKNFLKSHYNLLKESDNYISVGNVQEVYISNFKKRISNLKEFNRYTSYSKKPRYIELTENIYDKKNGKTDSGISWMTFYSGNVGVHRKLLAEQLFNEEFKGWGLEHFELGLRLLFQCNGKYCYNDEAINYHIAHPRETDFYSSSFNYAYEIFGKSHGSLITDTLRQFMSGQIDLHTVERKIGNKESKWLKMVDDKVMFNSLSKLE